VNIWVYQFEPPADLPPGVLRVAVKDNIDLAGVVTTAGSAVLRDRGVPATVDAACLAGLRRAGAYVVGKTVLTELGVDPTGVDQLTGGPVNPLAPQRIPGGSSSGSAVAVASGAVDLALGTDTGGSVRIPAACCGIVGLKPSWGRVPTTGVYPLARSLDVVGPLARDVAGVVAGLRLLDPDRPPDHSDRSPSGPDGSPDSPGWSAGTPDRRAGSAAAVVGRLRLPDVAPAMEDAVDAALAAAGLTVRPVELPGWDETWRVLDAIILGELWQEYADLLDAPGLSPLVAGGLRAAREVSGERLAGAYEAQREWRAKMGALLAEVELLALPTLPDVPPLVSERAGYPATRLTAPVNLAGLPALALPVPAPGLPVPASLQLVGPSGGEALLCATGLVIEQAVAGA
jgi:amidase